MKVLSLKRKLIIVFDFEHVYYFYEELTERINSFEQRNQRKNMSLQQDAVPAHVKKESFYSKKLHIFIPMSGKNDYATLKDADSCIETVGNLSCVVQDKSGHKKRSFDNTVYRLRDGDVIRL